MTTLVTGTITFPDNAENFSGATLYITLEANAPIGMPPEIAAQMVMRDVAYTGSPLAFTLAGDDVGTGGRYNLRVHISMDGSQEFDKGDYITKSTHTVLQNGAPDSATIAIERV
ncbi:MAG: hypothetical protein Q9P44_18635 [Anaerolineae bacterium]|nr:hypothetical protein [Anaerolineae bacterium]